MKGTTLILLAHLLLGFASQTTGAIEVYEGRLQDVVVAASGTSDSTFVTELADGWFVRGPNSFDIDKDGNIYILDWLGEKVVKFDKQGKWVLTFKVPTDPFLPGTRSIWLNGTPDPVAHQPNSDIAVDNWGNVYVTARDGSVLKFSPEGRFLFRLPYKNDLLKYLEVDKSGRFYNFADWQELQIVGVGMYDPAGLMKAELVYDFEYPDRLIVQKEAGDELYFRVGKYLTRTTLEDYIASGKLDTVAILPNKLRLPEYGDEGVESDLPSCPGTFLWDSTKNTVSTSGDRNISMDTGCTVFAKLIRSWFGGLRMKNSTYWDGSASAWSRGRTRSAQTGFCGISPRINSSSSRVTAPYTSCTARSTP